VIDQPRHLYIKGKVRWSTLMLPSSRIITEDPMVYRVGIEFTFESAEERDAIKKYCDELSLQAA
jgi:hypothetical protein